MFVVFNTHVCSSDLTLVQVVGNISVRLLLLKVIIRF